MKADGSLSLITGQIRHGLSLIVTKSQARLLLDRLETVGRGSMEAARRKWLDQEGWIMQKEQRAHMLYILFKVMTPCFWS